MCSGIFSGLLKIWISTSMVGGFCRMRVRRSYMTSAPLTVEFERLRP